MPACQSWLSLPRPPGYRSFKCVSLNCKIRFSAFSESLYFVCGGEIVPKLQNDIKLNVPLSTAQILISQAPFLKHATLHTLRASTSVTLIKQAVFLRTYGFILGCGTDHCLTVIKSNEVDCQYPTIRRIYAADVYECKHTTWGVRSVINLSE